VKVNIRGKWYTLKLRHRKEYVDKFKELRWKEVHLKYWRGRIFVSIIFEVRYNPRVPKGVTALDVNLKQVVAFDGLSTRRYRTRFINALSKRARGEELQKKYPKRWRYSSRILNRIRALHRRARNIVIDWCRKLAKELVLKARKHGYAIALEELTYLHRNVTDNWSKAVWKLSMFTYKKLQESIINKAIEYNVPIIFVNPKGTSTTCPRCGVKLTYTHRLAICRNCGFVADRDVVGAMNIWLRTLYAYAGMPGSSLSAPPMKDETRRRKRTMYEGMKQVIKTIQR